MRDITNSFHTMYIKQRTKLSVLITVYSLFFLEHFTLQVSKLLLRYLLLNFRVAARTILVTNAFKLHIIIYLLHFEGVVVQFLAAHNK